MEHGRDTKITVFKMKRRKGYRRKRGHRQHFTELRIHEISLLGESIDKGTAVGAEQEEVDPNGA